MKNWINPLRTKTASKRSGRLMEDEFRCGISEGSQELMEYICGKLIQMQILLAGSPNRK
jgi:hypothetical protein